MSKSNSKTKGRLIKSLRKKGKPYLPQKKYGGQNNGKSKTPKQTSVETS